MGGVRRGAEAGGDGLLRVRVRVRVRMRVRMRVSAEGEW